MITTKISAKRVRKIINEELERAALNEAVDHKSISAIISVASKLLGAIEGFKEKAPPAAINATTPHLSELEKVLENMVSTPGSYVPQPKKEPKKVTLKAVKGESFTKEKGLGRTKLPSLRESMDSELQDQFPGAWEEWVELCNYYDSNPAHSYFKVIDGVLTADGAQEYTKFEWNPEMNQWISIE